jgi:hypothetical protein
MSGRFSRLFAAFTLAFSVVIVGIGLALSQPAAPVTRSAWKAKATGVDIENAKKPKSTIKTIYAEQPQVDALFANDPVMKNKIKHTQFRSRDKDGFKYLTVHGTTVPARPDDSIDTKMQELQKMVQRGYQVTPSIFSYMVDVPYHYFISMNGTFAEGREIQYSAQTNTPDSDYGRLLPKHLTVVLEQQIERGPDGRPKEDANGQYRFVRPTPKQIATLERLLGELAVKHTISSDSIAWHSHYASTSCPGAAIIDEVKAIRNNLKARGI